MLSRSFLSSAASGSSSSSTCGRRASERASATRCRWPPESWSGLRFSSPSSLTSATISATRAAISARGMRGALQAERDVVAHVEMRKQRIVLEHHVDRTLVRQHLRDVLAVEQDAAVVRRLEAGQHPQQRGLAAAARAQQREKLAGPDIERQPVHRPQARRIFSPPPRCAAAAYRHAAIGGSAFTILRRPAEFSLETSSAMIPACPIGSRTLTAVATLAQITAPVDEV